MSNKENSKIESVESFTSNQEIIDYFENEDWDVDYLESLLTLDLLKNKQFELVGLTQEHLNELARSMGYKID
jgi:hypothetical protein